MQTNENEPLKYLYGYEEVIGSSISMLLCQIQVWFGVLTAKLFSDCTKLYQNACNEINFRIVP